MESSDTQAAPLVTPISLGTFREQYAEMIKDAKAYRQAEVDADAQATAWETMGFLVGRIALTFDVNHPLMPAVHEYVQVYHLAEEQLDYDAAVAALSVITYLALPPFPDENPATYLHRVHAAYAPSHA